MNGTQKTGSLLEAHHGILVHGCNAQGVMGAGVAKAVRERYPMAFERYRAAWKARGLRVGDIVWAQVSDDPQLLIANAITQMFYGRGGQTYVDYEAIRSIVREVAQVAKKQQLPVHYPMIGAGLGGGDWNVIEDIIKDELAGVEHCLWVPDGVTPPKLGVGVHTGAVGRSIPAGGRRGT